MNSLNVLSNSKSFIAISFLSTKLNVMHSNDTNKNSFNITLSLVLQLPPMTSKSFAPSVASLSVTARSQSGISPTALTPTGNHLHLQLLFLYSSILRVFALYPVEHMYEMSEFIQSSAFLYVISTQNIALFINAYSMIAHHLTFT